MRLEVEIRAKTRSKIVEALNVIALTIRDENTQRGRVGDINGNADGNWTIEPDEEPLPANCLAMTLGRRRPRTRTQLTIAESVKLLKEGHSITAADGWVSFPSDVMKIHREIPGTEVSRVAFAHLREHGFVEFDSARSKPGVFAVWKPAPRVNCTT